MKTVPNPVLALWPDCSDKIFDDPDNAIKGFEFNETVAAVFDDMVDRSVPLYREIQRMTGQLADDYAESGTNIVDLGCATGTTLALLDQGVSAAVSLIGVDNSAEMLAKCREKLELAKISKPFELVEQDLDRGVEIANASVVILLLTLQFVRPLQRERLMREVYEGLNPGGCVILVEKVLGENSDFNRLFIRHYYELKRSKGYSEMEIAQKREALENVLVPYRLTENQNLLTKVGFSHHDVFLKWYNFCGIVAVK